ncbi:hypothetical protein [Cylindrospermopsis raciborskii]|uniref:hypothetical protein n=2 Tax=Cylindrospermopsis raciborskii TaxID=77022 RepID=UPI0011AF6204|nr:hypothetical protein [Cylindrospermopsis raciborskii]
MRKPNLRDYIIIQGYTADSFVMMYFMKVESAVCVYLPVGLLGFVPQPNLRDYIKGSYVKRSQYWHFDKKRSHFSWGF